MTTIKPAPAKWFLTIKDTTHELTLDELKEIGYDINTILLSQFGNTAPSVRFVCEQLNISVVELFQKKKEAGCIARWCIFYLLRKRGLSLCEIARLFHMDHGSVCHGLKTLQDRIDTEPLKYQWLVQKAA